MGDLAETKIPLRLDAKPSEQRQKARHDQHIRVRPSKEGRLVLLYDSKLYKHLGKLKTPWLGPYRIAHITDAGVVKLQKLDGTYVVGMVNGSRLKPYFICITSWVRKKKMRGQRT